MKIKNDHFEYMSLKIREYLKERPNLVRDYECGNFPRSEQTNDLQERFCFDLAFAAGLQDFIIKIIYPYADDRHIFTALKKICPTVTRCY